MPSPLVIPDRSFRRAVFKRSVLTWLFVRMFAAFAGIARPRPVEMVFLAGVVAVAILLDARRTGEDLFLANLGWSRISIAGTAFLAGIVCEVVSGVAMALSAMAF